jgi:two-component system chemotaxis sensor kinase CheA
LAELDDITKEFLLESYEGLDKFERDLMSYEKNPADQEKLTQIYRTLHTLKGTSGFLGFSRLAKLAHAGENILSLLRAGKLQINKVMAGGLLAVVDSIRRILSQVEAGHGEGEADDTPILSRMEALAQPSSQLSTPKAGDNSTKIPEETPVFAPSLEDSALRVSVAQLDQLMNLTGELVLARNQAMQWAVSEKDPQWLSRLLPLSDLALRLQENVMKARLQPISILWSRFPRLVRDMADACGKKVELVLEGADTEIDKGLLEMIRDPLTHLVRNAVDHGLESPELRLKAGKPPVGKVSLKASHESGQVLIEVSDDGAGLSLDKIRAKAVKEKILSPEEASRLDVTRASQLIFHAGFSTAKEVTQFSGRGVGMDVVKANMDRVGGKVEVVSAEGQGVSIRLRIPLTLAVLPALLVEAGGQTFVLPRVAIRELIRLEAGKSAQAVEKIHQTPVYRLRDRILPLVLLAETLGLPTEAADHRSKYIAHLSYGQGEFGLLLDSVGDFQEVVVKPLGYHLKSIPVWSGSTILGDGRVALILDVHGLAQKAKVESLKAGETPAPVPSPEAFSSQAGGVSRRYLLFRSAFKERLTLEMDHILRMISIKPQEIQSTGTLETITYEGRQLLYLRTSRLLSHLDQLSSFPVPVEGNLQAVLCSHHGQIIALEVDEVLDILESSSPETADPLTRPGLKGVLSLGGLPADLLDLESLLHLETLRVGGEKGWNQSEAFEGTGIA